MDHENTVGFVRNLKTNRISPQFHVIYDDSFETVTTNEDDKPLIWEELLTFNSYKTDFEADGMSFGIGNEWLTEEELRHRVRETQEGQQR